jgi:tetratricopeptide (TPR) repeat protein
MRNTTEAESETRPQAEWLAVYGRHLDNVRVALDWAFSAEGDRQIGVALAIAVVPLWVQLSLLDECRERAQQALGSLPPDAAADARSRMQLSAALGWALMYGVGRAREAGPAWTTTLELAERLDDTDYRQRALWGLCIDQFNNGEFRAALGYAQRFADLVGDSSNAVDLILGDRILATALHYLGDQRAARHHIERVLTRLADLAQQPQIIRLRFDMRVSTHYFQARILWLQGFADQALQVIERNIEEGRSIDHALSFCSVLGQGACPIALFTGDVDAAARYGAMLLEHTERHPVRLWNVWARCFNGLVSAKRGRIDAGLQPCATDSKKRGTQSFYPDSCFSSASWRPVWETPGRQPLAWRLSTTRSPVASDETRVGTSPSSYASRASSFSCEPIGALRLRRRSCSCRRSTGRANRARSPGRCEPRRA